VEVLPFLERNRFSFKKKEEKDRKGFSIIPFYTSTRDASLIFLGKLQFFSSPVPTTALSTSLLLSFSVEM